MIAVNLDLLSVGITAAGIGLLGFALFFSDVRNITYRSFLAFSVLTILWSIANYMQYQPFPTDTGLWITRAIIFLGCWHAFTFFQLCYVFPSAEAKFPFWYKRILVAAVAFVSILTLTPLVFRAVSSTTSTGVVTGIENGPAIAIFALLVVSLVVSGVVILTRRVLRTKGEERRQIALMSTGTVITFVCIGIFNILLPAAFNNPSFLPLSALFIFPFIALTFYAVYRYHLFNLKVATTALLGFMVTVFTFVNVLYSTWLGEVALNLTAFLIVLIGSIKIVRDTQDLIRQRELIEAQKQELETANSQQENLLHFISHEIKGYLAKGEAAFAEIVEGDVGPVTAAVKSLATGALVEMRKGVATVMNILDASNLKKGTVSFQMNALDFRSLVAQIIEEKRPAAYEKRLGFDAKIADGEYKMRGDAEKLSEHVIRNLIDNAINYTLAGTVHIELSDGGGKIRFMVQDSGVGITPDDMAHLFTEGGHGKDSIKVNVHSTGYGLYIAKQVVSAHGGKIWAESDGAGKGSRFIVEFHTSV